MKISTRMAWAAFWLPALGACSDTETLVTPDECNPLGAVACSAPWPSGIYSVDDSATATGVRLDIPVGALPTNDNGSAIDPALINGRDGFSASAPIVTAFETGIDGSNLVHYTSYADSLTDASPTIIVDMTNGGRVVHFAELDFFEAERPERQALLLRPAERLRGGTRYAVGIRTTLKAKDGGDLPIPEGYRGLVDGTETSHPLLERVRPRYDEIFAAFAAEGLSPDDFVAAWDFTTASDESMMADMTAARDRAVAVMGDAGVNLSFEVTEEVPNPDTGIRRRVIGTFTAPLFLSLDGAFDPNVELVRDDEGLPVFQGFYDVPFQAIVPECAYTDGPASIVVYGHGLLGAANQAGGRTREATTLCAVVVGTDMRGMSAQDLPNVLLSLNDLNYSHSLFEALVQGVVNHIALEHIARGPMADELFVDDLGASLVDPQRVSYVGHSQGGIFGTTVVTYDPVIERGVLGVPAANYSMMLDRSVDWPEYRTLLEGAYRGPLEVQTVMGLMQMKWDITDPTVPARYVTTADAPPKQVVLLMAMGDAEVSNIATAYEARTMNIPVLAPAVYTPYGLDARATLEQGESALVIFDEGYRTPLTNETPEDNPAHGHTVDQPATWRMIRRFIDEGVIVNECNDGGDPAPCDCTQGFCD